MGKAAIMVQKNNPRNINSSFLGSGSVGLYCSHPMKRSDKKNIVVITTHLLGGIL